MNAQSNKKIPVIVGVTGHRNIVEEDKPAIKEQVTAGLKEVQKLCKSNKKNGEDTPVIMLNAFAQGADMLCAEAAFELGIDVYAVLPCNEQKYIKSFDDGADKDKLVDCLSRTKRQFVVPDLERKSEWLKNQADVDCESYEYRQLGIYIAEHSHILLALWDGKPPKTQFGCGTVEVINFALEHDFLDKDNLFKPGKINDSAVIWIKSRRQGDGVEADIRKKWLISKLAGTESGTVYGDYLILDEAPDFLKNIISKTVAYNSEIVEVPDGAVKLWQNVDDLDEYRKNVRYHYAKADELSYNRNQTRYNKFILWLAIIGTIVACTFLVYDDASLPFMIFPCTVAIGAVLWLLVYGNRQAYHKNYIEYRALAEALRIQFYMSACLNEKEILTNVCDLYAWTQKDEMVWIHKAIQTLAVTGGSDNLNISSDDVIEVWIGNSSNPKGQLKYHNDKREQNIKTAKKYERLSDFSRIATVAIYFALFLIEIVACILKAYHIDWFWEGDAIDGISWRNIAAIILGIATSASLLFSSYWGKLSFDRKADDNIKMCKFYASSYERWKDVKNYSKTETEKFIKEIAREEIVENGIWYSYVNENKLEINI